MEEWKQSPSHPRLELSSFGRVKRDGKIIEPTIKLTTYSKQRSAMVVGVETPKGWRTRNVHALVLEAFVGPRPAGLVCCHRDGNPANNHLDNLRWATQRDNIHDAMRHGTASPPPGWKGQRGEGNFQAKLCADDVRDIRARRARGETCKSIGAIYSLHPAYVTLVDKRRRWGHID